MYGVSYQVTSFSAGNVLVPLLKDQFAKSDMGNKLVSVEVEYPKVDLWFENQLSPSDYHTIDTIVHSHTFTIDDVKQMMYAKIDAKTDEIIQRGYLYEGLRFSTSIEAQARMLGVDQLRNDPLMQWPIIFNSMDDNDSISIPDADVFHMFFLTGIGYYRAAIDSGTSLKALVRAATTAEQTMAVTDPRQ